MLQNAYLLAKISADRADNERHFAHILQKFEKSRGRGALPRASVVALLHGTPTVHAVVVTGALCVTLGKGPGRGV